MAEFEERKRFWHIFYSPLVFIILLIVFILMARAMWVVYNHERVSAGDRKRIEAELVEVNSRAALLNKQVEELQTPQGIDNEIRSKFNVTKEGEGVAVIVNTVSTTSSTTSSATKEKSWWQKFESLF